MNRRTFLAAGTALGTAATAGCLGNFLSTPRAPPTVASRPDAVYIPSHVEGMRMTGTKQAGDYAVALMFSYPHRFWNITGSRLEKAKPSGDVHLMGSVWDPKTRRVLQVGNVQATIQKGGSKIVGGRPMWPMLSQNMGFHFGDNFALDGDGTYEVTLGVDPLGATAAGSFQGKFDEAASATFTFEYSKSKRNQLEFKRLDQRSGKQAALEPMTDMAMPISRLPTRRKLPGELVGQGRVGDAVFYAKALDAPPKGVEGAGAYLYVSPRTPYNRFPLPFMGLNATVERDGETLFDDSTAAVMHPATGYHYGVALDSLRTGDSVTLTPTVPPQVARHEGYETAFMEFEQLSMTV